MTSFNKLLIIILLLLLVIVLSYKNKEHIVGKIVKSLSPEQIFARVSGLPVSIIYDYGLSFLKKIGKGKIRQFGISFFVNNVSKIKDIGVDTLLSLNGDQIKIIVPMIVLPTIVPVLPKCLDYTGDRGLDFLRCIEIESIKILLTCGNTESRECKEKVCRFYIDILKFMIFREMPSSGEFKSIISILQTIQEFARTIISVPEDFPLIGKPLTDKGDVNVSIRKLFSNILFPDNIVSKSYILNDPSCSLKLSGSRQSFENIYPIIFNPLVLELANKLFIILDFPDKYRILFNSRSGRNNFTFNMIKPKQFEFDINGCSPRNPNWKRNPKSYVPCDRVLPPINDIQHLKNYFEKYFFYYTYQFLDSIPNMSNIYNYKKLTSMLTISLTKDLALEEGEREDNMLVLVSFLTGRRDKILCSLSNNCCY